MVSAGLTLIFGMMGVLNFAHASFYMLGAYVGLHAHTARSASGPALIVAPLIVGLRAASLVERYLLRRVHQYGHAHELLLTFGLAFIIEELIKLFYGNFPVNYRMPRLLKFAAFTLYEHRTTRSTACSWAWWRSSMFAVLYLLLTRTRVGIVVRAAIYRPNMVEALGHNVPLVFMGVFGVGAALAGLAGAVAGAFFPTNPNMARRSRRAGVRGGGGRRARLAGGRDGRLADDRPVHLVRGRPRLVARRPARPRRRSVPGRERSAAC